MRLVIGNRYGIVIRRWGVAIVLRGAVLGMPWSLCLKRRAWRNLFWCLRAKAAS
jgi:hypothetical protein